MTDDAGLPDLSPEEFAQVVTGPNLFALDWVADVLGDQVEAAWGAMSREFQLALAQKWVFRNPQVLEGAEAGGLDRDGLVERLLLGGPEDELFLVMRAVAVRSLKEGFGDLRVDDLGAGARPRPIGPDLEIVRLFYTPDLAVDERGYHYLAPGVSAKGVGVIVTVGDGWKVAGVGEYLLRPGWPPSRERIVGPGD